MASRGSEQWLYNLANSYAFRIREFRKQVEFHQSFMDRFTAKIIRLEAQRRGTLAKLAKLEKAKQC